MVKETQRKKRMVHGYDVELQYEIFLKHSLDYFDDVLPICIEVRELIKLEKQKCYEDKWKLVLYSNDKLKKHCENNEKIKKHKSLLINILYNPPKRGESSEEQYLYNDVLIYKNKIKHNTSWKILSDEEFENVVKQKKILKSSYDNDENMVSWSKYVELCGIHEIQKIVKNTEYFHRIVEIEKEMTNVELPEDYIETIQKVLSHPTLVGNVEWHGVNVNECFF